jgi:hypothetical protein
MCVLPINNAGVAALQDIIIRHNMETEQSFQEITL